MVLGRVQSPCHRTRNRGRRPYPGREFNLARYRFCGGRLLAAIGAISVGKVTASCGFMGGTGEILEQAVGWQRLFAGGIIFG